MKNRNLIVGFEMNHKESRICYYERGAQDAVSAEVHVGSSRSSFPTILCRVPSTGKWYFGLEAEYFVEHKNGFAVEHLYDLLSAGRSIEIEGQTYEADELMAIFLEKSLGLLGVDDAAAQLEGLMLTLPRLTRPFVRTIRKAVARLGIPRGRAHLQDYRESFFFHTLYQKQELWVRKVGMFRFDENDVTFFKLNLNTKTRPVTASVTEGERATLPFAPEEKDRAFAALVDRVIGEEMYSSVFLVGPGFDRSWAKQSISVLCRRQRKVYSEDALFAKGACYAIREKVDERTLKGYLYLGNDMISYNVGISMTINGAEAYYPLATAGMNWYEVEKSCEFLMDQKNNLEILVSKMDDGKKRRRYNMELPGLPERPAKASRLSLHLECDSPKRFRIQVKDLGFGELFPSSGLVWNEILEG